MKKKIWILADIIMGIICLLLIIGAIIILIPENEDEKLLTPAEMSAYSYRASELYAAGIIYTDKVLTTDPENTTYEEFKENYDKATMYWNELDKVLEIIKNNAIRVPFQYQIQEPLTYKNLFFDTAYAYDSEEIIKTFDGQKFGHKLEAVANLLGKDKQYAFSALQTALGETTAESWNNYGDTAMRIEQGLRVAKTAGQGAALYVGAVTGGASTALGEAVLAVNGASLIWQATDDGAFIIMGDDYKNNQFVANLNNVSDFVAPIAFAGDMLTMDFTSSTDKILSCLTVSETLRGVFQDGKVASISLKSKNGKVTTMTKDDLLDYQIAKENGQELPEEIDSLLRVLEGGKEFTITPSKTEVKEGDTVSFKVENIKDEYNYIWEYGSNKKEEEKGAFSYKFTQKGTYTIKVTVKDEKGIEVGKGSIKITVIEEPEEEPVVNKTTLTKYIGEWYASGATDSLSNTQNIHNLNEYNSGAYLTINNDNTYEMMIRQYKSDGTIKISNTYDGEIECDTSKNYCMMYGLFETDCAVYFQNNYLFAKIPAENNVTVYMVFAPKNTISGTFGGSYNGTTSRITFNRDGTGTYILTGNMETNQTLTYIVTTSETKQAKGIEYTINATIEAGLEMNFDIYSKNIVDGKVIKLNDDLPRIN